MKQHITQEQWDELIKEQQTKFMKILFDVELPEYSYGLPTVSIGQMIEFLGEGINIDDDGGEWFVQTQCEFMNGENVNTVNFLEKELCDSLWEACKNLLTNEIT